MSVGKWLVIKELEPKSETENVKKEAIVKN